MVPRKGRIKWRARQGHEFAHLTAEQFLFEEVYLKQLRQTIKNLFNFFSATTQPVPFVNHYVSEGPVGKESACNAGDLGSIPGWGRSPAGGHSNPLLPGRVQFIGSQSRTRLKRLTQHTRPLLLEIAVNKETKICGKKNITFLKDKL